ncbi:hypothetical protein ABT167_18215 [Streptomyces sp. NPDC001792]|uniref:hypothetical protein n=1 Tax=Streptomyces sp. NPDC001792 TaxID=3154524 RepID=UPI00332048E1
MSAATEVRAGLLNADVTPAADAAARCIQHTVDDLGLPQPDLLDELAAQAIVDELAERTPCRWGRHHTDAVRAALYRILADLAPPPAEGGLRGRVVLTF